MADDPIIDPAAAAPAPALEPAAPEPAVAPAPEPAPAEPAAAAEPAGDKPREPEPSLADQAGKAPEEAKPAEPPKPGDPPKPEAQAEEAPKPDISGFQAYTVPEGLKADEGIITNFNTVLADAALTPQDRGQKLIDMHVNEMTRWVEDYGRQQWDNWTKTRQDWVKEVKADPDLGGANFDTSMRLVASARDQFVPESQREAFTQFLRTTGAGDNPHFLRFMRDVGRFMEEPAARRPDFKPPPDIGKKPGSVEGRRGALYNHPNSEARRER